MKKHYVLKNKKRFCFFLVFIFTSFIVVFSKGYVYGYKENTHQTITIKAGDTLWDIAARYNKKGDIRYYIYNLKKLNDLNDSGIIEGSQLKVIIE